MCLFTVLWEYKELTIEQWKSEKAILFIMASSSEGNQMPGEYSKNRKWERQNQHPFSIRNYSSLFLYNFVITIAKIYTL